MILGEYSGNRSTKIEIPGLRGFFCRCASGCFWGGGEGEGKNVDWRNVSIFVCFEIYCARCFPRSRFLVQTKLYLCSHFSLGPAVLFCIFYFLLIKGISSGKDLCSVQLFPMNIKLVPPCHVSEQGHIFRGFLIWWARSVGSQLRLFLALRRKSLNLGAMLWVLGFHRVFLSAGSSSVISPG